LRQAGRTERETDMFVKIIFHNELVSKNIPKTKCYDCKKYMIFPGGEESTFAITLDVGEQEERVMQIPKKDHSVIVMNNQGETIDRFIFNK